MLIIRSSETITFSRYRYAFLTRYTGWINISGKTKEKPSIQKNPFQCNYNRISDCIVSTWQIETYFERSNENVEWNLTIGCNCFISIGPF